MRKDQDMVDHCNNPAYFEQGDLPIGLLYAWRGDNIGNAITRVWG